MNAKASPPWDLPYAVAGGQSFPEPTLEEARLRALALLEQGPVPSRTLDRLVARRTTKGKWHLHLALVALTVTFRWEGGVLVIELPKDGP